jgi:hypothetical protein
MSDEDFGTDIVRIRSKARRRPPQAESRAGNDEYRLLRQMTKQADDREAAVRRDAFDVHRYDQELKVLRTILVCALFVLFVGIGFSMWQIAIGREEIGGPMLSAIVSGALWYVAGLGTPRGLLRRGGPGSERGEYGERR